MHPFANGITGDALMKRAIQREKQGVLKNALLLIFFTAFFTAAAIAIIRDIRESYFFLFTTPAWIICFYYPFKALQAHWKLVKAADTADVFQAYGTPDEIAAVLSDPANTQVLDSRKIILTSAYLMEKNNIHTYAPLSEIGTIWVKSTAGRHARVALSVMKRDGTVNYLVFESGPAFSSTLQRMRETAEVIRMHMAQYAPECSVESY